MLAALSVSAAGVAGAARPQYGGVLRVELRAASVSLEPARWKAGSPDLASSQRLADLLFDRLVWLDNYGRFQPQLATEWTHDAAARRWLFTLRAGVKFSDGTALTPGDVVSAWQRLLPRGMQISATPSGVAIECAKPARDLLELLASGPYLVYKNAGGVPRGTGPFVLESVSAGVRGADRGQGDPAPAQPERLRFRFNELCWSGRPYLDSVEVALGVPPERALLDLQLGKTDLAELSVDTVKRAQQSNLKCWASAPLTLYALHFSGDGKAETEQLLRAAVALSVDRAAIAGVLLQKQAEPTAAFLPQWLSGYAFLFAAESNVERAQELRAKLPASAVGVREPLRVSVDASNEVSKLVAERVVVNARAAGLRLQTVRGSARASSEGAAPKSDGEAQLVAWRYTSLSPRTSLENLATVLRWTLPDGGVPEDPDARYAWEKRMLDEDNLMPLVAVPDFAGVHTRVRNWSPAPWGAWRLADVWLESAEPASRAAGAGTKALPGAKP